MDRSGVRNGDEPSMLNFTLDDTIDTLKTIQSSESIPRVIQNTESLQLVGDLSSIKELRLKKGTKGHGYENIKNCRCAAYGKMGQWARDRICPLYIKALNIRGNNIRKGENKIESQHKKETFSGLNYNEEESSDDF